MISSALFAFIFDDRLNEAPATPISEPNNGSSSGPNSTLEDVTDDVPVQEEPSGDGGTVERSFFPIVY